MQVVPKVEDLVDQLGIIEQSLDRPEVAQMKASEKRAAALRKAIAEQIKAAPEATTTVNGTLYQCVIGPREQQTKILSLAKVYALAKKAAFLEACSVTLKALEQLIPDDLVRSRLVKTERTGPRPVATYPIQTEGMRKAA